MDTPLRSGLRKNTTIQQAYPGKWRSYAGLGLRGLFAIIRGGVSRPGVLPDEFCLDGKDAEIEIHLDDWGIPHIRAQSKQDACLALGFMHGMDR
ncbi:penicillin acylase family protein, partial [Acidobacteriota bacterium]